MSSAGDKSIALKKARSHAKGNVTRKANKLNELLTAREHYNTVREVAKELKDTFKEFQIAHEVYHNQIEEESDKEESSRYFIEVLELVSGLERDVSLRRMQSESYTPDVSIYRGGDIQPYDSVSNASSQTGSKTSSVRSSASEKARAAAKKAALEAKAETLKELHDLQMEELKLQQRRSKVELQSDIAAAEAERKVYEQAEAEECDSYIQTKKPSVPHPQYVRPAPMPFKLEQPNHFYESPSAHDYQNNALEQLIKQQHQGVMALTLPQPSMQVFSGDPIDYCDFIRSFEHLIEEKTTNSSTRLYYLVQYTSGPAQELMKSCLSMRTSEGYNEARRLLKERFGQDYRIAVSHVQRIVDGPPIKVEDGNALQQFSIQLTSCANTLKEIGYLSKLDNPDNLKKIIDRLPYGFRLQWRDVVDRIIQRERRDITVQDITDFVLAKARAATHPIFGKITSDSKMKPAFTKPNRQTGPRSAGFATQAEPQTPRGSYKGPECPLCNSSHWLSRCDKFRKQSLEDRQKLIRDKKLCINCLSTGHFVRSCQKESFCKVDGCTGKHSTFLHPKSSQTIPSSTIENESSINRSEPVSESSSALASNGYVEVSGSSSFSTNATTIGLAIVPVLVKAKGCARMVETYAFLDSGSNTSFCTESLLKKLQLEGRKTKLALTTMHGENDLTDCSLVSLQISDLKKEKVLDLPMVFSRPNLPIAADAISTQEDVKRWPYLKGIDIQQINAEIGLLIGNDVPEALQPKEVRQSRNGGPFATKTVLGWVLNGPLGRKEPRIHTANFVESNQTLNEQFLEFCNLEFNDSMYSSKVTMSQNDHRALEIMEKTVKLVDGHYEIALPWKTYPPCLQNNKPMAERRLSMLKKRLEKDSVVLKKYGEFMGTMLSKDYARKVSSKDLGPLQTNWYLPHHPAFNPQKPGKIRVVFDCSAKYQNTSINDQLLQGPDLTNSLVGVLSRFRQERIAVMADIEAMFHQVRVRPSDCDALRFLWWPNGNLGAPPEEYQMRVHLFGGTSSPSCANFALKKTAQDNEADFDHETIETVKQNFYVDDCLKSVKTEAQAVRLAAQLCKLLERGGFKLTKWLSNSKLVLESIPESERAAQVKDLNFDQLPVERALGVQWSVCSDEFGFKISIKDRPASRRGILSIVSSVYDPLGFAAPFVLNAKLILQDLCRRKLDWDDAIPDEFLNRWKTWLLELPKLEQLKIDRCYKPVNFGELVSSELHHFSDASQSGYGAVTYLRSEDNNGKVKCSFVMGKSRLAPIKPVTIPRMELSAAVVATRLDRIAKQELTLPINGSFFWTDSTCVLRYIENQDKRFQTFVANRVATIHDSSSPKQWRYVNTQANPADHASRGLPADCLEQWIQGPEFLLQSRESWPQRPADMSPDIASDDPEVKQVSAVYTSKTSEQDAIIHISERFSSWSRLKKVIAWILRYKTILQNLARKKMARQPTIIRQSSEITPLSVVELEQAETYIFQHIQRKFFDEEFNCLLQVELQPNRLRRHVIKKSSSIYKLDPILSHGLIRVGGRLQRSPISDSAKCPIILPKKQHVTDLLIQHYHHIAGHSGLEYTLSLIRQRYWIINGRSNIRRVLSKCVSCRRRQACTIQQKMAHLPKDRVTPSKPPFTYTGVDCFGPFLVKRGRTTVKRYGVLFTCLTIRAIHIEVASTLDTDSFINALRRFIARRGQPEMIRSDNGSNFASGEKELRRAIQEWNQSRIHNFLLQRNIEWKFNPPAGSHHGGVWERCIRTVRKVMKALMKEQILDDEGLNTLLCEVESIVNGRPITKQSDDPRDLEPLTPNHLLLARAGSTIPPGIFVKEDNHNRRRWRQVQYLADIFWRRWVREYLPTLQQRQKWNERERNVSVNDIVLILDENKPRSLWPLGRVLEVHTNHNDHLVRSVKLKTSTTVLVRPVSKIVLLEPGDTQEDKED